MFRKATVFIGSFSLLLLVASTVMAQDWPEYRDDPLLLGPGNYLAWYKMLLIWVLVGPWVATTDWIGRDTLEFGDSIGMPSRVWNPIAVFAFLVGFLLAISIPLFFVGYLILFLGYVGPLITYIIMRNGRVTDDQKVLTREHLKAWLAARRSGRKGKGAQADGGTQEPGPPVKLSACGGSETENQANLIIARQSPGYVTTKELISDALSRRASRIRLDYGKESVGIRYDIDGVWHAIEPGGSRNRRRDVGGDEENLQFGYGGTPSPSGRRVPREMRWRQTHLPFGESRHQDGRIRHHQSSAR
jgi:hypothetical protein